MKAIIDIGPRGAFHATAAEQARAAKKGAPPDYRLHFESARTLFSELTPARLERLDTLHRMGACSVYALAREARRNYSNVHSDIAALEAHDLVRRNEQGAVHVPFDAIEIRLALTAAA